MRVFSTGLGALLALLLMTSSAHAQSCEFSTECDNGLFCDGAETCVLISVFPLQRECQDGTPPVCNDGIACTLDACSEEIRQCLFRPADADGDGRPDINCLDGSGVPLGDDCDDSDPNRFPGNIEVCDAADHDEDCIDTTFGAVDADGDGFLDADCCNFAGVVAGEDTFNCGDDCDDSSQDVHLNVPEVCNGFDDNCRNGIDEGLTVVLYLDADADGHGDPNQPVTTCPGDPAFSRLDNDCDDTNAAVRPGAMICNGAADALLCGSDGSWIPILCPGAPCAPQPAGNGLCGPVSSGPTADIDADGVLDISDNCPLVHNPDQSDVNGNTFGDACECGDVTGDGRVNTIDARIIQRHAVGQIQANQLLCAARS